MNLILNICYVLDKSINPIICCLAVFEFIEFMRALVSASRLKARINKLNNKTIIRGKTKEKHARGKIKKVVETVNDKDWDEFEVFLGDYQKQSILYSVFSMIIQLFTLLGILGTVAGLYIALNAQEMENMLYEGVGLALSTTILGIIFAVIFKCLDVFLVSYYINYIDDGIDQYEKTYSVDSEEAALHVEMHTSHEEEYR